MSQLRLRVSTCYRLLFAAKRYVTPYFADSIWMDVQERSDVLQVEVLHNARATLHEQVVAFAGCSAVEVEIARTELGENVLGDSGAQLHRLHALTEKLSHLFTRDPENAAGHHRYNGSL